MARSRAGGPRGLSLLGLLLFLVLWQWTAGHYHPAVLPSPVETGRANLHRRGVPVHLLDVTVWGILHVMTADQSLKGWADLKGAEIAVPLKGDMPDLVFRYLAMKNGLDMEKDLKVTYVSSPTEASQLLLAGRVRVAVLTEPVATAVPAKAKEKGMTVQPLLDLQQEWGKATGRAARIPQAGTMVASSLVKDHPEVVAALQTGMKTSVNWVLQNPGPAAQLGERYLGDLKAPVIEKSLARTPLQYATAAEARQELEFFFSRLMELSSEIIGGGLPDDGFYLGEVKR